MKKVIISILIGFFFLGIANFAFAQEKTVDIYFFYGDTCPACKKAKVFLEEIKQKYPSVKIIPYEVFGNRENAKLFLWVLESCGEEKTVRVPRMFIGNEVIRGYLNKEITGQEIEKAIQNCLEKECLNPLDKIGDDNLCLTSLQEEEDKIILYPIIGQVNLSKLSLPILTILVAGLDGFNPCAMWVLLFLIALLVNTKSRKKMWLIGGVFIVTSGIVYYLLLSAWLNLFLAISYVSLTRIIIGCMALGVGVWQIRKFIILKPGVCEIAPIGSKRHQKLSERAMQIVKSNALPATLIGIIILAFGVNLVEFFCSAGLPAIYTKILSLSNLSPLSYYLYLLLYTFIFMLDDLIIFIIAVITLSQVSFAERYTKWSILIGGLLMFILGFLMIFFPQFLMF